MVEKNENKITVVFAEGKSAEVAAGTTLLELGKRYGESCRSRIVAAKVNNEIKELTHEVREDCRITFVDLTDEDGMRIYRRSLYFVLIKAVHDLMPDRKVVISHSISKGLYCEIKGENDLTEQDVIKIENRMRELVKAEIPFTKLEVSLEEAKQICEKAGRMDRFHAVEYRNKAYVTMYVCEDYIDYFYGYMVPHTGYIQVFGLKYYSPGLIVMFPDKNKPEQLPEFQDQKKLFTVFVEHKRWLNILGVANVGALNNIVKSGQVCDLIRISEALQEKKVAQIADMIVSSKNRKRVVLISGPSSSGKTTFANRLSIQLRVNGLKPATISLDDYFVNRDLTPRDETGDYDFEALEAIDIKLFNEHLASLINGEEVEVPIYNFANGSREKVGVKKRINDDQLLVIEGIHGLNEKLTASIPRESKFKIYVSALTSMNIDDHNRVPTTDSRLIRRIVRDFQFRGSNALNTIKRWPSVRRGEEKNIFPFQEEADIMFNSALIFELGVLKTMAEPLLAQIDSTSPDHSEARRLLEFLSYFLPIDAKEVPMNSILREFIGGSCFY